MSKHIIRVIATLFLVLTSASPAIAQDREQFVSTSLFMLANFLPEPPSFFQLNYGRWLSDQDVLLIEAITWTYDAPLGIQYWDGLGDPDHDFPGHVRDVGVGLAYQRFWWKGFFSTLHATPFWQSYYDEDGEYIQSGFQLFVVARAGYRFEFWRDMLFVEPSVAITSWPINTNLPEGFAAQEQKWPKFFLFEPGLNIGLSF